MVVFPFDVCCGVKLTDCLLLLVVFSRTRETLTAVLGNSDTMK